jgi:hypothetical protein
MPAIDSLARAALGALARHDIGSIRHRLSPHGRDAADSGRFDAYSDLFHSDAPGYPVLISAEVADATDPKAERHRLIYSIDLEPDRRYHYFFEATIENGDTSITTLRLEPAK